MSIIKVLQWLVSHLVILNLKIVQVRRLGARRKAAWRELLKQLLTIMSYAESPNCLCELGEEMGCEIVLEVYRNAVCNNLAKNICDEYCFNKIDLFMSVMGEFVCVGNIWNWSCCRIELIYSFRPGNRRRYSKIHDKKCKLFFNISKCFYWTFFPLLQFSKTRMDYLFSFPQPPSIIVTLAW